MENIIEKINKLLALSESDNEHESQLAMLKAQELLLKHKLSLREVRGYKHYTSPIVEKATIITFKKTTYKPLLAMLIAENYNCYTYLNTINNHRVIFYGREEDASIAATVLEYAVSFIETKVRKLRYQYYKNGYSTKGLENDYALGFVAGLEKSFARQVESNKEYQLVLAKDEDLKNKYEKLELNKTIYFSQKLKGFTEEYYEGVKDGQNFSISNKLNNESQIKLKVQ